VIIIVFVKTVLFLKMLSSGIFVLVLVCAETVLIVLLVKLVHGLLQAILSGE